MAAVRGRPSGLPVTRFRFANLRTAATYSFGDDQVMAQTIKTRFQMNQYMPLTGHDCTVPALLIDTQAPLDVLHDAAVFRIRAVTQLLENLAFREQLSSDAVVLQDFAHLLAIPLRDGCDLLDVISRRLNADPS
jgi:hypothetical protein